MLLRCCDGLSGSTLLASEAATDRDVKRVLVPIVLGAWLAYLPLIRYAGPPESLGDVGAIAGGASGLLLVAAGRVEGRLWAEIVAVVHAAILLLRDVSAAAALETRVWSIAVVVIDMTLVARSRQPIVSAVIGCVLLLLYATSAEQLVRFGLFDAVQFGGDGSVAACDCASPPCALGVTASFAEALLGTAVLLFDFYVTRRFAVSMRQQVSVVCAAVTTCDELTRHLARYEVAAASEVLDGLSGAHLPSELRESYSRLLSNLESYLPYLPDSLLLQDEHDQCSGVELDCGTPRGINQPPGAGHDEADVCIVFTDIQSSTDLWEGYHQGMYLGLQLHNAVLRSTAALHGGYEVKTIGDSFMVAFSAAERAVTFAVAAQRQLLDADWPTELLQSPLCSGRESSDGSLLWKGLRVRVGVHCGTVRVDRNPVTRRCDYFGPPVNTAARIEAEIRHGGLVGVSGEVLERVSAWVLDTATVAQPLGARKLRGVAAPVDIHVLLPQELHERLEVLKEEGPERDAPAAVRESSFLTHTSGSSEITVCNTTVGSAAVSNARLDLLLRQSVASCAEVLISLNSAQATSTVPMLVTAVERAADQSQGVLQSVLSASCVVTWNAPRACAGHAAQCAHFLTVVRQLCDTAGVVSWAGAATGRALSGNVAGRRRRFATVIGGCVELARVLAGLAQSRRERSLVTGFVVGYCTGARGIGYVRLSSGSKLHISEALTAETSDPQYLDSPLPDAPDIRPLWGVDVEARPSEVAGSPLLTPVEWGLEAMLV